jgi:A/G-specific adenine glycosylase
LIAWQKRHGRQDLPWQRTRDPYRVWLSEVMLQQTQVAAVIPYYERFLARYPSVQALAAASEEEVLRLWSGLGYYARGRNLHAAARIISREGFPRNSSSLEKLPGIGRSTAAAIAAFAYGERAAILDGNVKRVLARCYGIAGFPGDKAVEAKLWALAERLLPKAQIETYTQALMDLGATLCARGTPRCEACPLRKRCVARKKNLLGGIPAPRPRKALPRRTATWLVLLYRGSVLLEKRPPRGLWGGLWTLPEPAQADVAAYCRQALGCEVDRPRKLEPIEHGFTHFRLKITPLLCEVRRAAKGAEAGGRMWVDLEEAAGAAIPTPVRTLLASRLAAPAGHGRRSSRAIPASAQARGAGSPRGARSPRR